MKKLLVTSALAALTSLSAQAKFEGAYAGVQGTYSTTSSTLHGKVPNQPQFSPKPSGYGAGINGGYGCNIHDIYVGGDIQGGYNWAKKTSNKLETKSQWFAGLGVRIGVHPTEKLLAYIYLGAGYNQYKLNFSTSTAPAYRNISKTVNAWSYVPGIGASYMVNDKVFLDANYKYSKAFSLERPKYYTWNKKPTTHAITLGVGVKF